MTTADLLAELRREGLRLSIVPPAVLRIEGPPEARARLLTVEVRQTLRERRNEIVAALAAAPRDALLDLLAGAVAIEDALQRAWSADLAARGLPADLAAWLAAVAPDLAARIRAEADGIDGAVMDGDEARLRTTIERWRFRWRAARIGFEGDLGLRAQESGWPT